MAVIDAKYKRLRTSGLNDRWVWIADLYQLMSYLARYDPGGAAEGALLYPLNTEQEDVSTAEASGP